MPALKLRGPSRLDGVFNYLYARTKCRFSHSLHVNMTQASSDVVYMFNSKCDQICVRKLYHHYFTNLTLDRQQAIISIQPILAYC